MAYKNGKITKNIKGVDYDVYVKTSADQVIYDDVISVKQKIIELAKALENANTGGSGIASSEVDAKIKAACDNVFNKIMGTTDQSDLNAAYDTLKEVSDYLAAHGTVVNGFTSDINDLKSKIEALNAAATHTNIDTLNKLSTSETGKLLFNGAEISSDNTGSTTEASWGSITGTLADQTDLKAALDAKANATDLESKADKADLDNKADKTAIPTVSNDLTDELKTKYDGAADNSHTHTNKDTIDKLSTSDAGKLLFDGKEIGSGSGSSSSGNNVEGSGCVASGKYSHAEGFNTTAFGYSSHAEGSSTSAFGGGSHAEGDTTKALNRQSHAEGFKTTASGQQSHAEGCVTIASGKYSHAEGYNTTAPSTNSHAEGASTSASGGTSHAEGNYTNASGLQSHAEGYYTIASGYSSHAEGTNTSASGDHSHAEGYYTNASNFNSHAGGHYNAVMTTGGDYTNTTGTAFVIGNGTSNTARSNAFSIQFNGTVAAQSTITASTTADYAEFFEWKDGNPDNEDRVGKFVTIDGNKIIIATSPEDYILGIVSGRPFVLGNGDCDTWNYMYLTDEFNRFILEPAPKMELDEETHEYKEVLDDQGNPVYYGTRPKLNPDYDHTKNYVSRFDRKEWAPVGMLGVLSVYQDGTCEVNGYAHCNENGIATACKRTDPGAYRVTEVLSDSIIKVILK